MCIRTVSSPRVISSSSSIGGRLIYLNSLHFTTQPDLYNLLKCIQKVNANIKDVIVRARVSGNANKSGVEGSQACLGCDLQKQLMQKIPALADTGKIMHSQF